LAHRNYRLFFFGQLVSLTGTWMQSVAQSWLAYRLTGSAALLGIVGFAGQVPALLFAPLGGVVADRVERRRILYATQVASMAVALALAVLALGDRIRVPHLLVLAALLGVVNGFDIPARQSFVVEMVGREDLGNAIALNSSIFNGARVVGPALAGLLVAAVGEGWCFLANAVSYLAALAGLAAMRLPGRPPRATPSNALTSLAEGFRYVARTGPVRALLLLLGLVSLTGMPYAVLMPIFADRILGGGARGLGLLLGATGLGALLGAIALAARDGTRGLGRRVAGAAVGFGAALVLFAASRSFWLSAALLVPAGFAMMNQMASSNTLLQSLVPDDFRGRVMAAYAGGGRRRRADRRPLDRGHRRALLRGGRPRLRAAHSGAARRGARDGRRARTGGRGPARRGDRRAPRLGPLTHVTDSCPCPARAGRSFARGSAG